MTKLKSSKTLVAIRSDDYHAIKLSHFNHESTGESLMMCIEDSGGTHIFTFADAHELRTFAERVAEQARLIIE